MSCSFFAEAAVAFEAATAGAALGALVFLAVRSWSFLGSGADAFAAVSAAAAGSELFVALATDAGFASVVFAAGASAAGAEELPAEVALAGARASSAAAIVAFA